MSQSGLIKASGGGGGGVTSVTADSGTATPAAGVLQIDSATASGGQADNITTAASGNTVTVSLNNSISQPTTNATGTEGLYSLAGSRFMHNYASGFGGAGAGNTFLGFQSGNLSNASTFCTGIGNYSLSSLTTGLNNSGIGADTLQQCTSGSENTAVGSSSQRFLTTGIDNTSVGFNTFYNSTGANYNSSFGAKSLYSCTSGGSNNSIGYSSQYSLTTGSQNNSIGYNTLTNLVTGGWNLALGHNSGSNYTTSESNNILINHAGVVGESNVTRIGIQGSGAGQQNECFVAGITGVTNTSPNIVTINTSTGQLGTQAGIILVKKTLTSAQIKNLTTVPFVMVAAQGANTVIVPVSCALQFVYGGTNQFIDGSTLYLAYANGVGIIINLMTNTSINGNVNVFSVCPNIVNNHDEAVGQLDNQGVVIYNHAGVDFQGNAAGDNTLIVTLAYYVATLT